jgi:hypothetical protein
MLEDSESQGIEEGSCFSASGRCGGPVWDTLCHERVSFALDLRKSLERGVDFSPKSLPVASLVLG